MFAANNESGYLKHFQHHNCRKLPLKINTIVLTLFFLFPALVLAGTPGEVKVGGILRDASLYGFSWDYRKLSDLRGKPLIINVWASWCQPCRAEMGSLERLNNRYGGKQFNIIGISTDDDRAAASRFLKLYNITFDNYADYNLTLENMLGANTIPLTLLINSEGRVLKKVSGYHQWDSEETIEMIAKLFDTKL